MESLTRLVTESLARHGFDRPLDYRRLHWSHWFRCESHHSLLAVPSKPGVFAIAEEIADLAPSHVGTAALGCPAEQSSAAHSYPANEIVNRQNASATVEERSFSDASSAQQKNAASAAGATRRLLAVTRFFDADDMAFTLDRMLTRSNPMRARLASGRYFVRFVVIEEESQRRSISAALNQWIASQSMANTSDTSAIGAHFASSLELTEARVEATTHVGTAALGCPAEQSSAVTAASVVPRAMPSVPPHLDSGAASNIHCPSPLPSGF
jgi:hypothetical protein